MIQFSDQGDIMSGHSKWSTIKHKKGAADVKRGKLFSQLSKAITVSVRESSNGNPDSNPALRLAVEKARGANMPSESIKRAINRGLGEGSSGRLEEVVYEGYGPMGVGILAVARTDNRQRTGSEVRYIFDRNGGSLGQPGSAGYLFEKTGNEVKVKVPMPISDERGMAEIEDLILALEENDDIEDVFTNMV